MPPTPLWLDCDPGHDDAFAILLSAHHPSLHLLGVSTVYGNASLAQTTNNARSVLQAIGRSDITVHAGASQPFCRNAVHAPDIHGASGLDGTDLLPAPPSDVTAPNANTLNGSTGDTRSANTIPPNAIVAMRDALLTQPPHTAWIVATGALTNIALLVATFPEVLQHIAGLSVMGGAVGGGFTTAPMGKVDDQIRIGNTTPYAEFNIYCDPEAARAVLGRRELARKTVLVTLDLTHQVLATKHVQERLLTQGTSKVRTMFYELLMFFASTYESVFGIAEGPPLHDPIAVAVLLDQKRLDDAQGERWAVDVVTDGEHYREHREGEGGTITETTARNEVGRTVVRLLKEGEEGVRVPRGIDVEWFWGEMLQAVSRAEKHVESKVL